MHYDIGRYRWQNSSFAATLAATLAGTWTFVSSSYPNLSSKTMLYVSATFLCTLFQIYSDSYDGDEKSASTDSAVGDHQTRLSGPGRCSLSFTTMKILDQPTVAFGAWPGSRAAADMVATHSSDAKPNRFVVHAT